ncbi:MAG: hypothetical protein R3F18_20120 [Lysobacterales bacterium]|nr:hypothetical protein [Xanthomonadales bacterium]
MPGIDVHDDATCLKSLAGELFEAADPLLSQVSHFGVLDSVLAPIKPLTRSDYVKRHCSLLLKLKKAPIGIGLSRKLNFPNEDDFRDINYLTGLAICQSWSVILNLGHLFGTFATERSLLFLLDRDLGFREEFIRECTAHDAPRGNRLRKSLENILDSGNLNCFHYLLACWRISNGFVGWADELKRKALTLISVFIDPPSNTIVKLKDIFRRTRRLTYLSIHEEVPERKHKLGAVDADDLLMLFPKSSLGESDWLSTTRWQILEKMDVYDNEQLFSSARSAAVVLGHIEAFQKWWRDSPLCSFRDRVAALYFPPSDWPKPSELDIEHFAQIRLPTSLGWMNEVRLWLNNDRSESPWGDMKFIISPTLADRVAKLDLYLPRSSEITAKIIRHLTGNLSRAFSSHIIDQASHSLWSSTALLMSNILSRKLVKGYRLQITPIPANDGHAGFACAGESYEFVRGRIKKFLPASRDQQRNLELRQLISICDGVLGWRTPCLIMLAKLEIVAEADERLVGDIDGLACFPAGDAVMWLVMESKANNSNSGERQVRRYMENAFGMLDVAVEKSVIGPQTSWHCVF